jgi:hypothetical protein
MTRLVALETAVATFNDEIDRASFVCQMQPVLFVGPCHLQPVSRSGCKSPSQASSDSSAEYRDPFDEDDDDDDGSEDT